MRFISIASLVLLAAAPFARADVLTVTGPDGDFSFTLPSDPTPDSIAGGYFFTTPTTTSSSPDYTALGFGSSLYYLDFGLLSTTLPQLDFIGPQLYTGDEATPTLVPGVYTITDYYTGSESTLTISETPEPSSLVLLGTGLAGAISVYRRKRNS